MQEGKWVPIPCWFNCGGKCLLKALIVDGKVVRLKTDDSHPDSLDYPQQRACVKGWTGREVCFGEGRIRYPMKRKHWEPGTGGNRELRGRDTWERISWDEAINYIAEETKRIVSTYGNRSVLAMGVEIERLFSLYGGHTSRWGTTSQGSWLCTYQRIGYDLDRYTLNDRQDFQNCDYFLLLGTNPAWSAGGSPMYLYLKLREQGKKFVSVDPFYNDTAAALGAEWIPIRPATDVAFLLGLAYVLITEDDPKTNPLIDWDYLNRCTLGFDRDHMPEGCDPDKEMNFRDYVLGRYDDIPKSPEWAETICGVSAARVRQLAYEIGVTKSVGILCGWASGRTQNSDNLPQLIMTIGAMTGRFGRSGQICGMNSSLRAFGGGPLLFQIGGDDLPKVQNPIDDAIADVVLWQSILDGKYHYTGNGRKNQYLPAEERELDIRMIYHAGNCRMQSVDGVNLGIQVHRKVDFVVSQSIVMSANSMYADIVLPINTWWEREGNFTIGNREALFYSERVVESQFESKSDQEVACLLADKLGIGAKNLYPLSEKQQLCHKVLNTRVQDEEGKMVPLVTVTQEDLEAWDCAECEPQQGKITWKELREQGVYQIPRSANDPYVYIAYENFRNDPEKYPLKTSASGKMEIFCEALREDINGMGHSRIEAIPTYIPVEEGYTATFKNWETKEKGEYPFQLFTIHYPARSHSDFAYDPWLNKAFHFPIFVNSGDAEWLGLKDDDLVLVESRHGKCKMHVCTTERIMPGVVTIPHGILLNHNDKTGIAESGSDNVLCGSVPTGAGVSGYNSCICSVRKWEDGNA